MHDIALIILSGLSIGILGSFHCVGMCGPLALALPVHKFSDLKKYSSILLYNFGRAFSYAIMGLVFGIICQSFSFFKLQQYLSIFSGSFILLVLILSYFGKAESSWLAPFTIKIKNKLSGYLKAEKTPFSFLSIGIINGFLPCGLVYIAIATSIATGSILKSALLMFAFGMGTLPIMSLTMYFGKYISLSFRSVLTKMTPYIISCVAVLLILRGLNLGIPYVSPKQEGTHQTCCHKP